MPNLLVSSNLIIFNVYLAKIVATKSLKEEKLDYRKPKQLFIKPTVEIETEDFEGESDKEFREIIRLRLNKPGGAYEKSKNGFQFSDVEKIEVSNFKKHLQNLGKLGKIDPITF